jgi:hypothetical protein
MNVVEFLARGGVVPSGFGREGDAATGGVEFLVLGGVMRSPVGAKGALR